MGDEHAVLTGPLVFAGFELTHNHKQKYRLSGVDTSGGNMHTSNPEAKEAAERPSQTHGEMAAVLSKADVAQTLAGLSIVKGKYEQELQFAFIQEGVALTKEDEIFSGNRQIYSEMRCRLRR